MINSLHKFFSGRGRRKYLAELRSIRHTEDDLLSPREKDEFDAVISRLAAAPAGEAAAATAAAQREFGNLPVAARYYWLRNLLDLLVVVGAVAFGLRGLFFQPFRIPTSSMQPTLYGVHYREKDSFATGELPGPLMALLYSARKAELKAPADGRIDPESIRRVSGLSATTAFTIGGAECRLPGEPRKVVEYSGIDPAHHYRRGETIADGYLSLGDHLFVERFSLYLREPKRGDVTVFNTDGLLVDGVRLADSSGYYYNKRLVGLPGDTLKIIDNQLYVRPAGEKDFRRIQDLDPRFEKLYSGQGGYQGHLSGMGNAEIASGGEYTVPEESYFMLGDNSRFSLDSRFFGAVPRRNLVGRAWLVFWPFSRRAGIADSAPALPEPTGEAVRGTYPVMYRQ